MNRYSANFLLFFLSKSHHKIKFVKAYFLAFLFFSLYFIASSLSAQKLFITAKYNKDGVADPSYTSNKWKIDAIEGSFLYVLFKSKQEITDSKLYLFIDKKVISQKNNKVQSSFEERFEEYDNKKIYINKKRNWAAIQYTFLQAGVYKISIADANKKIIISKKITINYKAKIVFSNDLNDKKYPVSHQKNFKLEKAKQGIYIFIKDETSFNSESLKVIIEKQNQDGNYQKYTEETFFIDKELRFSFFNQIFELKGTYRISIFKDEKEFLAAGFLKVV
ncbi:hypothetical protein Fleli_1587 [Bernardetia litoralis DSM 6794]|uniref:Uncharacterized protein n=1 Tax=Bernardetia litoralis (strain ATCC 23117 / DSM 6794 / NBRC 15988 / NCIMB 1366 / Fx l1 / Sio-4) TaxID=880071 RepID=I4AJ71_BERLS|nr:hypothetical protein [Bernardetia litoralis]AFM04006.1 hypothetical protein Fleli_1587 [Bernardetia litoralis DSM 6794]